MPGRTQPPETPGPFAEVGAESTIERSLAEALAEYSVELDVQRWLSPRTAVATVRRYGVEATYQMVWLPHATLSELARVEQKDDSHRLLVAGRRITSRTADALVAAGIDYVDYAGNTHLDFEPVLIDVRGRHSPAKEPAPRAADANLFSTKRMQVLFALLTWPELVGQPIRRIAEVAGTSVGITQSTLDILKGADYVIERSLHRRDELIELWSAAFRTALLPSLRTLSFEGDIKGWSATPRYLVSGEFAVETIRHPGTLTIYSEHFDLADAARYRWKRSDEPNIEIRHKFWRSPEGAFIPTTHGPFAENTVPPLLVYADLLASNEARQAEVAQNLRSEQVV
ncbi:hypothetical protein IU485_10270 [Nocardia cyriacigeorgica]|nr:type IV toxin-antitoxin system AbiEi family antitoxin [Nocardia cyriacigeorgica]MBF6081743.1 hypothetical protein [Nocardia cyriacigeorgica]MBF6424562.1 hypothetical protein [Nocardia cyriacigeorgica]BDT88949.1 hypothetical protein FMUAM8_47130 [Nocardia cyriacigeorgica]